MEMTAAMTVAFILVLFSVRPVLAVKYNVIDLNPSGFSNSYANSTSGMQQVGYGYGTATGNRDHALLWSGTAGSAVDLNPNGFSESYAKGTSGTQQIGYGYGTITGDNYHALLWSGTADSAVDLNPSGFTSSYSYGISGTQQVGYGYGQATGTYEHALLWSGTAGSAVDLNPIGFDFSEAFGIKGTQQVGWGFGTASDLHYHALLWSGTAGSAVDLNPSGFTGSQAVGTNGTQQIGYGGTNNKEHALLWSGTADSAVDLNPSGFSYSYAFGISGTQQVGYGVGSATGNYMHALLWSGTADSAFDLNQFLPDGFTSSFAQAIDDQGNIYGYASDSLFIQHAILWVPVPEPSTFALLGMGAFGLLAWVWRRGWKAVLFVIPKMCVAFVLLTPAIGYSNPITELGLTIDVTGPGGMGVKQVQPGPMTGEIWATVKGLNLNYTDEKLNTVTGGLRISGGGSFLPFDTATNYLPPWIGGSIYPVDLSPDGKTLGHEGQTSYNGTGVLCFKAAIMQVSNEPFRLGTFQANLEAGDSIQFLLSGRSVPMYSFTVDNALRTGAIGYDLNLIHVGEPLVAVPEPSTFVLLGMGVFGLFAWVWRRGRKGGD
jgi:hypothetical protein